MRSRATTAAGSHTDPVPPHTSSSPCRCVLAARSSSCIVPSRTNARRRWRSLLGLLGWPQIARITRGAVLERPHNADFVTARRHSASRLAIPGSTSLPNSLPRRSSSCSDAWSLGTFIVAEATLSFLGIGARPPDASCPGADDLPTARPRIRSNPETTALPGRRTGHHRPELHHCWATPLRDALDPKPASDDHHDAPLWGHQDAPYSPTRAPRCSRSGPDHRVHHGSGVVDAVRDVDLDVARGEPVAIVGQSGSGKSTRGRRSCGCCPAPAGSPAGPSASTARTSPPRTRPACVPSGAVASAGAAGPDVQPEPGHAARRPGRRRARADGLRGAAVRQRALELLAEAGVPEPERRAKQFPHEFSGGMRQRVLIAVALAREPELLLADEPTSALDVTVQRRILDHLDALAEASGTAMILVTHDLGLAADRADRVLVMSRRPDRGAGHPRAGAARPAARVHAAAGRGGARSRRHAGRGPAAVRPCGRQRDRRSGRRHGRRRGGRRGRPRRHHP